MADTKPNGAIPDDKNVSDSLDNKDTKDTNEKPTGEVEDKTQLKESKDSDDKKTEAPTPNTDKKDEEEVESRTLPSDTKGEQKGEQDDEKSERTPEEVNKDRDDYEKLREEIDTRVDKDDTDWLINIDVETLSKEDRSAYDAAIKSLYYDSSTKKGVKNLKDAQTLLRKIKVEKEKKQTTLANSSETETEKRIKMLEDRFEKDDSEKQVKAEAAKDEYETTSLTGFLEKHQSLSKGNDPDNVLWKEFENFFYNKTNPQLKYDERLEDAWTLFESIHGDEDGVRELESKAATTPQAGAPSPKAKSGRKKVTAREVEIAEGFGNKPEDVYT